MSPGGTERFTVEARWYFLVTARVEASAFGVCLLSSPYLGYALFGGQVARRQGGVRPVISLSPGSRWLEEISSPGCTSGSDSVRVHAGLGSERVVLWEPKGLNAGIVVFEYP